MNGMCGIDPHVRPPLQGLESFLAFVPRALPWAGIECPFRAVHANIQRMLTAKTKRDYTHDDLTQGIPSTAPTERTTTAQGNARGPDAT